MAIKSFNEFQLKLNQTLNEKRKQELEFRIAHKAEEQERVVNNILGSLEKQVNQRIQQGSVEPVSTWEYSIAFNCVTKDDVKQIINDASYQIEIELIKAGYKFEIDIQESAPGYKLIVTLLLDVQSEPESELESKSEAGFVTLADADILIALLQQ